ncbi:MAG TPA: hypothetical protein VM755_15365 [Stellaceae bacterium]|nr:hypothetical protein [Stellaceae bacterium]
MYRKSPLIFLGMLSVALGGIASAADAATWYWSNGSKCQVSDHPPAFELAHTRALGGRIVAKGARTEIVLPQLEAYKPLMQKGFHFVFFKNEKACGQYLQDQARIKADEQRAHQEYEDELKKK